MRTRLTKQRQREIENRLRRIPRYAGWYNRRTAEKGPNGRLLCRWCGTEVPSNRTTMCSKECVHELLSRTNPGYQAEQVAKRDKGICLDCSADCIKGLQEIRVAHLAGND